MDVKRHINRLKAGASYFGCGAYLSRIGTLRRLTLYNTLGFERLKRKYNDIQHIYIESEQNWQQTFYIMLLRTMGGMDNKEAFTTLAHRVSFAAILRERMVPQNIEAMLIGTSGLLQLYPHDEYILNLKRNFSYLSTKYSIQEMEPKEWKLTKIYPNNHPILRLSQIATLLSYNADIMECMLVCRTRDDVHKLFSSPTLPYWTNHYTPASENKRTVAKRLGRTKTDLLAINLVAQMQYAYGDYINNDTLRNRAISLLEDLPAESNSVIAQWNNYGSLAQTAFDSQALLQLSFEYCHKQRCEECPVGVAILNEIKRKEEAQNKNNVEG
ncbi:MAG: DUF2851 family protein [Alistipes sp.]|nr:DUF2851 family protein [Alistipes sp.]